MGQKYTLQIPSTRKRCISFRFLVQIWSRLACGPPWSLFTVLFHGRESGRLVPNETKQRYSNATVKTTVVR